MKVENEKLSIGKNVPKLRFGGFEGDWGTVQLKEILDYISYGFTNPMPEADVGPYMLTAKEISDGKILYSGARRTTPEAYSNLLTPKSRPLIGDILLTKDGTLGRLAVVDKSGICINQSIAVLRTNSLSSSSFVYQLLTTPKYQSVMLRNAGGSTIKHIYITVVDKMLIGITSVNEQQKIASFLSKVDEKIGLLSEKKAKLVEYKKGVMQGLFSGEWKVESGKLTFVPPTLRFKADDGSDFPDWEKKRFNDISDIKRGASPRPISDPKWFDANSSVGWVRISDVTRSGRELLNTEQYLTKEGIKKSRLIPVGSMIMSICATIGKPIYTTFPVCIHDGFVVFSNLSVQSEYIYYYLVHIEKNWYKFGQPGSQVNLNTDIVGNEIVHVPSLEEQVKISNFLSAIDKKIDLTTAELEKVKEWKKGLLQQMFV